MGSHNHRLEWTIVLLVMDMHIAYEGHGLVLIGLKSTNNSYYVHKPMDLGKQFRVG
jgi:hypothetical protein